MKENGINDKLKSRIAQKEEDLTSQTETALNDMGKRLTATLNTGLNTIEGDIKKQLKWSLNLVKWPMVMVSVFLLLLTFATSWGMGTILKRQVNEMQQNKIRLAEMETEAEHFREMNLTTDLHIGRCVHQNGQTKWCAKVDTATAYKDEYYIIESK